MTARRLARRRTNPATLLSATLLWATLSPTSASAYDLPPAPPCTRHHPTEKGVDLGKLALDFHWSSEPPPYYGASGLPQCSATALDPDAATLERFYSRYYGSGLLRARYLDDELKGTDARPREKVLVRTGWGDADLERSSASSSSDAGNELLPVAAPARALALEGLSLVMQGGRRPKRVVGTIVPSDPPITKVVRSSAPIRIGIARGGDFTCQEFGGANPGQTMAERTTAKLEGPYALGEGGLAWILDVVVGSCTMGRTGPLVQASDTLVVFVRNESVTVLHDDAAGYLARLTTGAEGTKRSELVLPIATGSELAWTLVREVNGALCRTEVVDARLQAARRSKVAATLSDAPPASAWTGPACVQAVSLDSERFTSRMAFDLRGDGSPDTILLRRSTCGGLEFGDKAQWCPYSAIVEVPDGPETTLDAAIVDETDRLLVLESKHHGCRDLLVDGPDPSLHWAAGNKAEVCDYALVKR